VANRKATVARTNDDHIDKRPHVPGVYRTVLRHWCREEVLNPNNRYPVNCCGALEYEHEEYTAWEAKVEAVTDRLFTERVGLGEPVDAWWYWLPKNLPAPLDKLGRDPAPRRLTVYADDRIDARNHFEGLRKVYYERARYSRTCDHGYFQAAFALAGEWGA
jgi:hypothetical protein